MADATGGGHIDQGEDAGWAGVLMLGKKIKYAGEEI